MAKQLAISGGTPMYEGRWPRWPRAAAGAQRRLLEVLDSTRWAVSGPPDGRRCVQDELAVRLAQLVGTRFASPCASGSAALILALRALGIGVGHEVIVPALTWVATAATVLDVGATPVVVDVSSRDLGLDVDAVAGAITAKTRALVPVHYAHSVSNMDALLELAEAHSLAVIEDCAQAIGATHRGRSVGSIGQLGVFSTQQTKVLTSGEGGFVSMNDERLHCLVEQTRLDGRVCGSSAVGGSQLAEVGEILGGNRSMSEFQAAVLLAQLDDLPEQLGARRRAAAFLADELERVPGVTGFRPPAHVDPSCYLYPIVLSEELAASHDLDQVVRALGAELGTTLERFHPPLGLSRLFGASKWFERGPSERVRLLPAPNAEKLWRSTVCLPHPMLLAEQHHLRLIPRALAKVLDRDYRP